MVFEPRSGLLAESRTLTTVQRHDVRHRQISISFSVLPWAAVAHLLVVVGLTIYVIPPDSGFAVRAWPVVAGLVGLIGALVGFFVQAGVIVKSDRLAYWFLIFEFAAVGVLYSGLAIVLLPLLDHTGDLVLTSTIVAMIGAGTLATATLRTLGIAWVLSSTLVLAIAFWLQPGPEFGRSLIGLTVYGCALIGGIAVVSGNFEARFKAEKSAAAETAVAQMLLDDFEGNAGDFVWETDWNGKLTRVPTKLAHEVALDPALLLGSSWQEVFANLGTFELPGGRAALVELEEVRQKKAAFSDILIPVRVEVEIRWWKLSGRPAPGLMPEEVVWRGVGSDVTAVKVQSDEIVRMGKVDALTGMPNRHSFWTELERSLGHSGRAPHRIALAMLDLDNFKSVNDTLGHSIGDEVLKAVGTVLSGVGGEKQLCARLGGDEFAILLRTAHDHESVETVLRAYSEALREPIMVSGNRLEIGGSIGYHISTDDNQSADELMTAADLALYAAKESGRGSVLAYRDSMQLVASRRANILEDIGNGVDIADIELRFLPQLDVRSRLIVAVEVDSVWNNPRLGAVSSTEFMAIAADAGLASSLGATVFDLICNAVSHLPSEIRVAVTVSARELESEYFVTILDGALTRWEIPAGRIELQLTEAAAISDRAKAAIRGAARRGVSLAVDEFGTGFSSLASLSDLPFTRVRIDQSFSGTVTADWPILAAVVSLVDSLGMEAVILGVDSEEQLTAAVDMRVRTVQGRIAGDMMSLGDVMRTLVAVHE